MPPFMFQTVIRTDTSDFADRVGLLDAAMATTGLRVRNRYVDDPAPKDTTTHEFLVVFMAEDINEASTAFEVMATTLDGFGRGNARTYGGVEGNWRRPLELAP